MGYLMHQVAEVGKNHKYIDSPRQVRATFATKGVLTKGSKVLENWGCSKLGGSPLV